VIINAIFLAALSSVASDEGKLLLKHLKKRKKKRKKKNKEKKKKRKKKREEKQISIVHRRGASIHDELNALGCELNEDAAIRKYNGVERCAAVRSEEEEEQGVVGRWRGHS
jgi:hypothetical protein